MESKHLSPILELDNPPRPQAHEINAKGDQGSHARLSGKRVFEVFDNQNSASAKSKHPLSKKLSPFTDKFFANVAEAIVRSFPFTEFAKENGCELKDVVRALKATVVEPLSYPLIRKGSTPRECAPRVPETVASTPKRLIVPCQPESATVPPASSSSTVLSPSTHQIVESQEEEAAASGQIDAEFVRSATATFKPFKLPESGRLVKRRKTMAPAERQFVKQDAYGNYVAVKSQTASGRLDDNGSKRR
ncbi:hypothetical protein BDW75DRAFT_197879 [Aspergillus navahoensis]